MKKWYGFALAFFLLDRLSKEWARHVLSPRGDMPLWPGMVGFRYAQNTGMAFSLGSGGGWMIALLGAALVVLVGAMIIWGKDFPSLTRRALLLVLAGGMGNLIDRVAYGFVVDFISLEFIRFAVFNVADMAICLGSGLAVLGLIREEWMKTKAKKGREGEKTRGGVAD